MRQWLSSFFLAAMAFGCGATSTPGATSIWQIDPRHSAAEFSVRHMMISNVRGQFSKITGTINLDEQDVTKSSADITIDATTVDTREPDRDKHLRSGDFFDVQNFPTMTFRSKRITQASPGKLKMTGDLTIRGTTREVTFDWRGPFRQLKSRAEGCGRRRARPRKSTDRILE